MYAEALARFMAEQESDQDLTAVLNRVCQEVDTSLDEFGRAASRRTLARSTVTMTDRCLSKEACGCTS